MPKLIALLVCEKVVVDQQQVPSLIGVFQRVNIPRTDAPIPEDAVSPMKWVIFSMWEHAPNEIDKEFIQRIQATKPNGEKFIDVSQPFKLKDADLPQSKNSAEIFGVPVGREGDVVIRVWLEGQEGQFGEIRFNVKYQAKGINEPVSAKPN